MREDINFKGADTESDFWLTSILCSKYIHLTIPVCVGIQRPFMQVIWMLFVFILDDNSLNSCEDGKLHHYIMYFHGDIVALRPRY